MYGYIYLVTNLINGKIYVGKKTSDHFRTDYYGSGSLIKVAVKKYGIENFNIQMLESVNSISELNEREQYWISFYNATNETIGYNISKGGSENDYISFHEAKSIVRKDSEIKELLEYKKELLRIKRIEKIKGTKSKTKFVLESENEKDKFIDPLNIFVVNKNGNKMFIDKYLLQKYFDDGWLLGWP